MNLSNQNYLLTAYSEAVQFFESLESSLHEGVPGNLTKTLESLNTCAEKVATLINLEPEESFYKMCLYHLHTQIIAEVSKLSHRIEIRNTARSSSFRSTVADYIASGRFSACSTKDSPPTVEKLIPHRRKHETPQDKSQIIDDMRTTPTTKGLKDIVGLHDTKRFLHTMIVLPKTHPQLYTQNTFCNSVLLFGPPGTGKTKIVHALAVDAGCALYCISPSDILSKYIGETERTVKTIFQHMSSKSESKILFIDEIDGLCRKRTDGEFDHTRRLKTQLLSQFSSLEDNPSVFVICATNCPWDLDAAFIRRFQRRLYIGLPSRSERLEFLQARTQGTPLASTFCDWGPLLNHTDGFSCNDLENLVRHTMALPIMELQDTKVWVLKEDGFYRPLERSEDFPQSVCCNLSDLPAGSVQARTAEVTDFIKALDVVTKSVPEAELKKYERYIQDSKKM